MGGIIRTCPKKQEIGKNPRGRYYLLFSPSSLHNLNIWGKEGAKSSLCNSDRNGFDTTEAVMGRGKGKGNGKGERWEGKGGIGSLQPLGCLVRDHYSFS